MESGLLNFQILAMQLQQYSSYPYCPLVSPKELSYVIIIYTYLAICMTGRFLELPYKICVAADSLGKVSSSNW